VTSLSRTWRIFGNVCQPHLLVRCEKCFRLSAPESLKAIAGPKQWMLPCARHSVDSGTITSSSARSLHDISGIDTKSRGGIHGHYDIFRGPAVSRHGRFRWRFNIHVWLRPLRLVHGPTRFWECCVIDQTSILRHGTSELRSSSKTVGTAWPLDREFRATKIVFERGRAHEKIAFMTPYVVEEVHNVANKSVEAVRVRIFFHALERIWREHSLMKRRRRKYQRKKDLATIKARIAGSSSRAPQPLLTLHGIDESGTYISPTMLHASVTFRPQQNQMGLALDRLRGMSTSSWLGRVESVIQYTYLQISFG
jgi:hypothetical protein